MFDITNNWLLKIFVTNIETLQKCSTSLKSSWIRKYRRQNKKWICQTTNKMTRLNRTPTKQIQLRNLPPSHSRILPQINKSRLAYKIWANFLTKNSNLWSEGTTKASKNSNNLWLKDQNKTTVFKRHYKLQIEKSMSKRWWSLWHKKKAKLWKKLS